MTTSRGKKAASKKSATVQAPVAKSSSAPATKKVSTARRQSAETHLVEWKESWRDEYLKWLCGFANADGGTLIIGMNDKGQPVGAENAERLLVDLPNKIRDTLGLVVPVRAVIKKGKALVEIVVEASPTPISYRGEYHFRSGSTKQQLTGNALSTFLLRKFGRHWDSAPVPNVAVKDPSAEAFKLFKSYAREIDRMPPGSLSASRAELIERLRLTETGMLKRASRGRYKSQAKSQAKSRAKSRAKSPGSLWSSPLASENARSFRPPSVSRGEATSGRSTSIPHSMPGSSK